MAEFLGVYSGYLIAAVTVIAALLIFLLVYRAIGGTVRGRRGQRLGISEYHEIDKTRRLVLVRRDNVEHLILIGGGGNDVVIESGIGETDVFAEESAARRPLRPKREAAPQPEADDDGVEAAPAPPRPAPRPAVFGDRGAARLLRRSEPRLSGQDYGAKTES